MKPVIVEKPPLLLVGFNFFGDPFTSHAGWSEENEIGRLWKRWTTYFERNRKHFKHVKETDVMYEIHVYHAETPQTGEFEVFAGMEVAKLEDLPPEVVAKVLPESRYAVFTLVGQQIISDWPWLIDSEWLPPLDLQRLTTFSIQRYDERFKGMQNIEESELDVYIPLIS